MFVCEEIEPWLGKMGYSGKIPNDLRKICNPSTVHIWEQLISKIKPKDEVDAMRKNIIIRRLQEKPLEKQDEFPFPIKEIEVYTEKLSLEKKLRVLEDSNNDKDNLIDQISLKNNQLHIKIGHTNNRIKEHKQKKFLLENKIRLLEEDVKRAEEVFAANRNSNESSNSQKDALNRCAEKIQKRIDHAYAQEENANGTASVAKPRESLGVLPDDLWNTSDEFDNFLSFDKSIGLESQNVSLHSSPSPTNQNVDWFTELCNEESIKKSVKDLLETNSIGSVRTSWESIYQKLLRDLSNNLQNQPQLKSPDVNLDELYLFHIKTALEAEKLKENLDVLMARIAERKEQVLMDTEEKRRVLFELQLEEVGLKAANNLLHKTATTFNVINDQELPAIQEEITRIKEEIVKKTTLNKEITEKIYKIFWCIESAEHEKSIEIRRLDSDLFDPNILNNLKEEVISKEIQVFCEFPTTYHYQKNINPNERFSTIVPSYVDLNDENVTKISRIIDEPYSPVESIVLNVLQLKNRIRDLQSLESGSSRQKFEHCNKAEFGEKGKCIEQTVSKLMKINNSALVQEILKLRDYIKEGKRLKETKPWEQFLRE